MTRPALAAAVLLVAFGRLPARASVGRHEERVATAALPAPVRVLVMTPPSYEAAPARRFPVLYFLHDGGGDEETFFRERLADALDADMRAQRVPEMLVVVPRGVGTWFIDAQGGASRYARFLTRTLVPFVDARYRTVASRGSRLVAGISMGGYGALRWALAEPGLFCAAGGLSPAVEQMCWPAVQAMPFFIRPSLERTFGDDPVKNVLRQNDLYAMLLDDPRLASRAPFLYVRCGTEDKYRLSEIVTFFDRYLDAFGIPHAVVLETGVHDWPYWRRVFPEFVRSLSSHLSLPEATR
ncbi:MAG TPA: alpha/beta hydrolase-fold protein [Thermoanaerobaculia bacterium]|nr:alpha/beta hydrolase-fold protein [Thermoanaerobaculia bacterium]